MDDGLRVECWDEQRAKSCCDRFGFSLDHGNFFSRLITLIVIVSRVAKSNLNSTDAYFATKN